MAAPEETTATLGTVAAPQSSLKWPTSIRPKVDLIICATSSPEHFFPATASIIQDNLGINQCRRL